MKNKILLYALITITFTWAAEELAATLNLINKTDENVEIFTYNPACPGTTTVEYRAVSIKKGESLSLCGSGKVRAWIYYPNIISQYQEPKTDEGNVFRADWGGYFNMIGAGEGTPLAVVSADILKRKSIGDERVEGTAMTKYKWGTKKIFE